MLKKNTWKIIWVILTFIYIYSLNWAIKYITVNLNLYKIDFNILKLVNGLIWIVLLLYFLPKDDKKSILFFLMLRFFVEIIPISILYWNCNKNFLYYNIVCFGMLICELLMKVRFSQLRYYVSEKFGNYFSLGILLICVVIIFAIVYKNGLPSLKALNIYKVYDIRGEGALVINKYLRYILRPIVWFGIPLLLTKNLKNKKFFSGLLICGWLLVIYLYTGMKSYLFLLPLVVFCVVFGSQDNFCYKSMSLFNAGISLVIFLNPLNGIFRAIYSLIVRRVIIEPANLKYCFYEFFSVHPKMGIGGILPTWIVPNPYGNNIGYMISDFFWDNVTSNNNTGVLGEAYARFGFTGIFLFWIIYAMLLKGIGKLEEYTSSAFVLGTFVFAMYSLTESWFFGNILIGEWGIGILIILLYYDKRKAK